MRPVFQLMIVYTFLDPLLLAVRRLLLATGQVSAINRAGWVQLAVFIPAVIAGARLYGIFGVALAADLMVLVGVVLLFRAARGVVDFSPAVLWLKPAVAVAGPVSRIRPSAGSRTGSRTTNVPHPSGVRQSSRAPPLSSPRCFFTAARTTA